jgi:hypothetical protein
MVIDGRPLAGCPADYRDVHELPRSGWQGGAREAEGRNRGDGSVHDVLLSFGMDTPVETPPHPGRG